MKLVNLSLRAGIVSTPAMESWLRSVEDQLEPEAQLRWSNLMIYGTTHPEVMIDSSHELPTQSKTQR